MEPYRAGIRFDFKRLEHPWLVRQTETHLVFGVFARRIPLVYAALVLGGLFAAYAFFAFPRGDYADALMPVFGVAIGLYGLAQASRLQQSIIGWCAVKFALLLTAIVFLAVGTPINLHNGAPSTWPDFALALIWIPSLEFIPVVTPHQRYLTIARLLLTVPFVYLGIASGNWHWQ